MRSKLTYRNLNWEYEFIEKPETTRHIRNSTWMKRHKNVTIRFMNIYNPDGNKIITFEYPNYVKFDMKIIESQIDNYIIKARKKKLENLNNLDEQK